MQIMVLQLGGFSARFRETTSIDRDHATTVSGMKLEL